MRIIFKTTPKQDKNRIMVKHVLLSMGDIKKNNNEGIHYGRVMTFGLSEDELEVLRNSLPSKNTEVFDTDEVTDLVALAAEVLIIKADALDKEGRELLLDYYNEVGDSCDEAVFWIGKPCLPKKLMKRFKIFASFDDLEIILK